MAFASLACGPLGWSSRYFWNASAVPSGAFMFPLLSVERLSYTYNDVPMELRRGFYRTDTHHYRNELS